MDLFANGFSIDLFLNMLRRRAWIVVVLFSVSLTVVISAILFLPNLYSSSAVILVEGQQIPQEFVRATVTMALERRLQTIGQAILSRSQLERLAEQMDLYSDLRAKGESREVIAAAMRRDIHVGLKGAGNAGTVAFAISYTSPDQQKVALVANTLADAYIAENEKLRVSFSSETEAFLRQQLEATKKKLEAQEQQMTQYKQAYLDELPEQREANLQVLDGLQQQLRTISDNLARARERRALYLQRAETESSLLPLTTGLPGANDGARAGTLQDQLRQLQARGLTERHPDVILLRKRIAIQEQQQTEQEQNNQDQNDEQEKSSLSSSPPLPNALRAEIVAVDNELQRLSNDFVKVQQSIAEYQQRIENAPRHEQAMFSLSRDYNTTRDLYASLLKRADEASLAEDMERNQKSERFRLLERAIEPTEPIAPQRTKFLVVGFILSLGVAIGGALTRELLDTSFHRIEDLKRFTPVPVLVAVPQIITSPDRWRLRLKHGLGAVMLIISLVGVVSVSYWVGSGNEKLVRVFLRSPNN